MSDEVLDGRNSEAAYLSARRMRDICNSSATADEAESRVASEFPSFDLGALRAMGFYFHRFNPKGSRHVRQR